jgi:hypothetical protein
MALNQFGAIMTFAIEMEQQVAALYDRAAGQGGKNASEFSERAEAARKRAQKLEASRRQNVTEITLEAIVGLDEADYTFDYSNTSAAAINALEETIQRFYSDVTPKINVLESRQVLQRCLKEHSRLEAIGD